MKWERAEKYEVEGSLCLRYRNDGQINRELEENEAQSINLNYKYLTKESKQSDWTPF